jgi:hypothetical protein
VRVEHLEGHYLGGQLRRAEVVEANGRDQLPQQRHSPLLDVGWFACGLCVPRSPGDEATQQYHFFGVEVRVGEQLLHVRLRPPLTR